MTIVQGQLPEMPDLCIYVFIYFWGFHIEKIEYFNTFLPPIYLFFLSSCFVLLNFFLIFKTNILPQIISLLSKLPRYHKITLVSTFTTWTLIKLLAEMLEFSPNFFFKCQRTKFCWRKLKNIYIYMGLKRHKWWISVIFFGGKFFIILQIFLEKIHTSKKMSFCSVFFSRKNKIKSHICEICKIETTPRKKKQINKQTKTKTN
jgi:hypothetical protein